MKQPGRKTFEFRPEQSFDLEFDFEVRLESSPGFSLREAIWKKGLNWNGMEWNGRELAGDRSIFEFRLG